MKLPILFQPIFIVMKLCRSEKRIFACDHEEMILEYALFLKGIFHSQFCSSFRKKQWICELDDTQTMWTNPPNGHCLDFVDNTTDTE